MAKIDTVTSTYRNGKVEKSWLAGDMLIIDTIGRHYSLQDIILAQEPKPEPKLTITVKEGKKLIQEVILNKGDQLLIQY